MCGTYQPSGAGPSHLPGVDSTGEHVHDIGSNRARHFQQRHAVGWRDDHGGDIEHGGSLPGGGIRGGWAARRGVMCKCKCDSDCGCVRTQGV